MKKIVHGLAVVLVCACTNFAAASSSSAALDAALFEAMMAEPTADGMVQTRPSYASTRTLREPRVTSSFDGNSMRNRMMGDSNSYSANMKGSNSQHQVEGDAARFILFLGVALSGFGVVRMLTRGQRSPY